MARLYVRTINGETFCETGNLYFSREHSCYYINGSSYPEEIVVGTFLDDGDVLHEWNGGQII